MKAGLILLAICLALVLALGEQMRLREKPAFSIHDEFEVRESYPGGYMNDDRTQYTRCEGGQVVIYEPGGPPSRRYTLGRGCWR